jgi:hypothetical protein
VRKGVGGRDDVPAQGPGRPGGRAVAATLAVGLALLIGAIALVMSRSGMKETGSNRVRVQSVLASVHPGETLCQSDELVPAGTGTVRAAMAPTSARRADLRVTVRADADGRIVARGTLRPDARGPVSVPVRPLVRRDTPASVCFATGSGPAYVVGGEPVAPGTAKVGAHASGGHAIGGDVRIVYLEPRPRSWWSFAPTAMERMDAGRRLNGSAIGTVVLLLSAGAAGLSCVALVRGRP